MSRTATRRKPLLAGARPGSRAAVALRRRLVGVLGIAFVLTFPVRGVGADVLQYSLEIRDREAASYVVELPVRHPGTLSVEIEWTGGRTLAFRIEGPGSPAVKARRAGPSPQRAQAEVTEAGLGQAASWRLFIHSLRDRGEIDGILTVNLPSPHEPDLPVARSAPDVPAAAREPWLLPDVAPRGADARVARVFETSESLRAWIVDVEGAPRNDPCGWHSDLLRYLAQRRGVLRDGQPGVGEATSRFLIRVAKAVRLVEQLRSSDDPILAGPLPEGELEQRAWESVRRQRIEPVEDELDALRAMLRKDYAPELADETWPQRLVGCLTTCERYFEQRTRLGRSSASNGPLAADQWNGILAAAGALEALASSNADPTVVIGEAPSRP